MSGIANEEQQSTESPAKKDVLSLYTHITNQQSVRNKIFLHQNLFSLVESGEKVVHYANRATTITNSQFAILSSGNCLLTEKLAGDSNYQSTLFYFDDSVLTNFFIKYATTIGKVSKQTNKLEEPFLVFEKDEFIRNFISALKIIQQKPAAIAVPLLQLKFEEVMLHLLEKYPEQILSFQMRSQEEYSDLEITKAVEQNITNNVTLEELAFLCNTSVSTFKRRFQKLYNVSPRQYFLQRKMEIASGLLLQNENPGEVYHKVGYENHSSFSQSFRQVYGITPKEFQQQRMTY